MTIYTCNYSGPQGSPATVPASGTCSRIRCGTRCGTHCSIHPPQRVPQRVREQVPEAGTAAGEPCGPPYVTSWNNRKQDSPSFLAFQYLSHLLYIVNPQNGCIRKTHVSMGASYLSMQLETCTGVVALAPPTVGVV